MSFRSTHPAVASFSKPSTEISFFVPRNQLALAIRNGVPERFYPPGFHALPQGRAKVEVRLLTVEASQLPKPMPPDSRALKLPYERSLLHLDGELVGIVKPSCTTLEEAAPVIPAWEGFHPLRERHELKLDSLQPCLGEPLRACFPKAGLCCGARMPAFAVPSRP